MSNFTAFVPGAGNGGVWYIYFEQDDAVFGPALVENGFINFKVDKERDWYTGRLFSEIEYKEYKAKHSINEWMNT
jgi:hypothetical protein